MTVKLNPCLILKGMYHRDIEDVTCIELWLPSSLALQKVWPFWFLMSGYNEASLPSSMVTCFIAWYMFIFLTFNFYFTFISWVTTPVLNLILMFGYVLTLECV